MCGGLRQGRRAAAARTDVRCERMSESANPGGGSGRGESVLLSVVVPCYDEEAVVRETHRRLAAVLEGAPGLAFEIVYVDDGSRDSTLDALRELQRADPRVRIVALSRRFGQEVAIAAGVEHAGGDVLAIIDADLQDPPELLLDMLERWRGGADAVHGVRTHREGETAFKRWTSRAFYRLINRLSDVAIPLDTGYFRLLDRKVADALLAMPERDRFMRGMVAWTGFRQEPLSFRRAQRAGGATKYLLRDLARLALDGILSFSLAPLRLAIWMGFLSSGVAVAGIAYAIAVRLLTDTWIGGWSALFVAIMFFGGAQLVVIGILGEYVGRIYGESKRRPLYFVRERLGFPPPGDPPRSRSGGR